MAVQAGAAATAGAEAAQSRVAAKKRDRGQKTPWWMWIAVAAILIFCLFPFYWLVNISLKNGTDLQSSRLIPPHPTLDNYRAIFKNPDFTAALRNSAIVALTTT